MAVIAIASLHKSKPAVSYQLTYCDTGQLTTGGAFEPATPGTGKLIVKGTVTNLTTNVASYSISVVAYDGKFPVGALDTPARALLVRPGESAYFGGVGLVDHQHQVPQSPTCKVTIAAD